MGTFDRRERLNACTHNWKAPEDQGIFSAVEAIFYSHTDVLQAFCQKNQILIIVGDCLHHTNASLLVLSNRVDIVSASKKLGHADANVAARYYLHAYEEGG